MKDKVEPLRFYKKDRSVPKPHVVSHADHKAPAPPLAAKPNPLSVVANWFNVPGQKDRFVETPDGYRLDNVPISMTGAIRECNRQRKARGLRQIDTNPFWVV